MSSQTPKLKILIVKKDASLAALMREFLSFPDYQVELAFSAQGCLARMASAPPDLLLMGLMFADSNGMELLRRVRSRAETAALPVIVVSALLDPERRQEAEALGVRAFVPSPFTALELLKAVREALEGLPAPKRALAEVLVVDDDESTLDFCRTALEFSGFGVATAKDGAEALASLDKRRFDVVLTDNVLLSSSQSVLQAVKARWPQVRVVVMSGNPKEGYVEQVHAQGASDFLLKPFLADKLLAALRRSLAASGS